MSTDVRARRPQSSATVLSSCALLVVHTLLGWGTAVFASSRESVASEAAAETGREMGEREADSLADRVGIAGDSPLVRYVRAIGQRLAVHAPRLDGSVQFRFDVLDVPEPSALSLPGGLVYVSRGLVALANSEDEIASVIAHEIGHLAVWHVAPRRMVARLRPDMISLPEVGAGPEGPPHGHLASAIAPLGGDWFVAPYDAAQEREADWIGQELTARAGWNPSALASLLRTLEREQAEHDRRAGSVRASYLAAHPTTFRRVAVAAERAADLARPPSAPIARGPDAFLEKLDGMRVGPHPAFGVVLRDRFVHAELGVSVSFPPGWELRIGRRDAVARHPDGEAAIVFESVARGRDPVAVAQSVSGYRELGLAQSPHAVPLGRLPVAHAVEYEDGAVRLHYWIAVAGRVVQLTCIAPSSSVETHRQTFEAAVRSVAPMSGRERSSIRDARLRLWQALDGERLSQAIRRISRKAWTLEQIAIANALEPDGRLRADQILKIAVREPFRR